MFFFFVRIFHFWILASVHQFQEVCMKQKLACMCQIFEQKTIFVMAKKAIAFSLYQWFNQSKVNRNKVCVNLFYSFIVLPKTSFRCHFFGHYFSFTFFFFFFLWNWYAFYKIQNSWLLITKRFDRNFNIHHLECVAFLVISTWNK